ncbi:helix-hairpin-helix domain-containing protein [Hufsiella ginkgonis]|uniref:Helix-hairpin-helix domain-containing protein n=1 Tax=Hufsiella ginkgonis TaxID=2695274 RepID=A0A7K1Y4U5_9SPHI|nr:helix-hairpin-helix domain-containing protein [Hufsiella ginkgonis]MXV17867.1 hypothetical protein [Hufsiella ginkgonis]
MEHLVKLLSFTKRELNGILILFAILLLAYLSPYVYEWLRPPEEFDLSAFRSEIARFETVRRAEKKHGDDGSSYRRKSGKPYYFKFDPNGLPEQSWLKLGLSSRQVRTIKNFELKGGRFYRKEDLRKIYSISAELYGNLEPYIQIVSPPRGSAPRSFEADRYERLPDPVAELNTVDSAGLEAVRGIGPAFASRIIRYRDRLGGFYKKEQLLEVYGMDSARYGQLQERLKIDPAVIRQIPVNTAGFDDLKKMPYLTFKQVNAILQYRKQHGPYRSADDLSRVLVLPEEVIRKIIPYLVF